MLGISSGARLAVALGMLLWPAQGRVLGSGGMILLAFGGAMLSMGVVLLIAGRVMLVLVIRGIVISYLCSAATDFIVTFADDANIVNLHNWSMGSFSGITWENVRLMTIVCFLAMMSCLLLAKPMGAYQLGETYARSMGVNIRRFRVELVLLSSILAVCVTAFAGPISFVGIAVPHLVKRLLGTARPLALIPGCFLGGAAACLFCDLAARTLFAPTELAVGYGRTPLIRQISLHVRRGEIVTLIGSNGSGKSTILKSIIGQLEPMGGMVWLDGISMRSLTPEQRARRIGNRWRRLWRWYTRRSWALWSWRR